MIITRLARIWALLRPGILALALTRPAMADSKNAGNSVDSAAAQALFDHAKQLMATGRYSEACPKLEESQRLDPASGTLLNLGDCYEKSGRLATAWTTFLDAAAAANRAGNTEREAVARKRAEALVSQLSKIAISVVGANRTPGLEVLRDGVKVGEAQWGIPIPTDSGEHRIKATAPGRQTWESTLVLHAKGETVTATVPELSRLPTSSVPAAAPSAAPGALEMPVAKKEQPIRDTLHRPSEPGFGTQRVLALAAGGLGVIGVAVGTGLGLQSQSKRDQANEYCDGAQCRDEKGVTLKSEALQAGNVSTAAFVVGAVGLASGVVLWVTAPRSSSSQGGTQVAVAPGTVLLRGTW